MATEKPNNDLMQNSDVDRISPHDAHPDLAEPRPDPTSAPTASPQSDRARMSLKDKSSLIISILALVVSVTSASINYLDNRAKQRQELKDRQDRETHQLRQAYKLGEYVVYTHIYSFEVPLGPDPPEVKRKAQEEALRYFSTAQNYIATLKLDFDMKPFLPDPATLDLTQDDPLLVFNQLSEKILLTYDKKTQAAFDAGQGLTWFKVHMRNAPDNGDAVRKNYWLGQYADELPQINGALAALAFNEPLSENATSTDRVAEECVSRKRHLEKLLGISEISERPSTRKVTRQEIEDAKKIPKNVR